MIDRKGNKTDRTVMMENAVSSYFEKQFNIHLYPETKISY